MDRVESRPSTIGTDAAAKSNCRTGGTAGGADFVRAIGLSHGPYRKRYQ